MAEEIASVKSCTVTDCTFNDCWSCLSPSIVVGDHEKPVCKTYTRADTRTIVLNEPVEVKACNMFMCLRNRDMMCTAYDIRMRLENGDALCRSYKNRYR